MKYSANVKQVDVVKPQPEFKCLSAKRILVLIATLEKQGPHEYEGLSGLRCVLINNTVFHDNFNGFNRLPLRISVEPLFITTEHADILERITIN